MEAFIGTIMMVGFNYAPIDWMICDGAMLPIAQYQPLFALLGTTYGGDGVRSFCLPDLRACVPGGAGGKSGVPYVLGGKGPLAAAPLAKGVEPQVIGLNFIICAQGIFPRRQ